MIRTILIAICTTSTMKRLLLHLQIGEKYFVSLPDYFRRCPPRYHTPAPLAGLLPDPDSTLINGKGRFPGGPTVPLTTLVVKRNKRYRFRLVSLSCRPNFNFSIDGHTMVRVSCCWVVTKLDIKTRQSSKSTASTSFHSPSTASKSSPGSATRSSSIPTSLSLTIGFALILTATEVLLVVSTQLSCAT